MGMIDVSRHANLKRLDLKVRLLSPMFLGGADGNAELRPAPFKSALRYWWRLTQPEQPFKALLKTEQRLFGGIAKENNDEKKKDKLSPCKGRVSVQVTGQVRIDDGKTNFETKRNIIHPEVKDRNGNPKQINSLVYLGMGPIFWNKTNSQMEYNKSRIVQGSEFNLNISFPANNCELLKAISLLHHFGSVGGRSRNSWGSLAFITDNLPTLEELIKDPCIYRPFDDCLNFEYPTALPYDKKGILLWHTTPQNSPFDVMHDLANLYVGLRTSFVFNTGMTDDPEKRHILGYPVTNHKVKNWEPDSEHRNQKNLNKPKRMKGRMPSQLRFKIIQNDQGEYIGRIVHIACQLPKKTPWNIPKQKTIWGEIHKFLDGREGIERTTA